MLTKNDKVILLDKLTRRSFRNDNGCLVWTGAVSYSRKIPYGAIYVPSLKSVKPVHRVAYEIAGGKLKLGLVIDHLCNFGLCVEPKHLKQTTQRENLLRGNGTSAQHARKTHCPKGHPYSGENLILYKYPTRGFGRFCRICRKNRRR